jgi:pyridoxamine 5'-phosphate oxidase
MLMRDGLIMPASLDETVSLAWAMLSRGVADRRSAFHAPMLGTVGTDGGARVRVVILRGCRPAERQLRFHTDLRTEKIAEIRRCPKVALTGYDAGAKVQIRVEGVATLHVDDAIADEAWAGSRPFSRVCYGTAPAPGTQIAAPDSFSLPADDSAIAAGREHFCAATIQVGRLEWLYLAHGGHRRARFEWHGEDLEACWLAP